MQDLLYIGSVRRAAQQMVTSDESAPRQGFTPLHTAASHSSFQSHLVTADLLEAGAPLEAVDDEGRTPLLVALDRNRKEAIEVLIAAGMHHHIKTLSASVTVPLINLFACHCPCVAALLKICMLKIALKGLPDSLQFLIGHVTPVG